MAFTNFFQDPIPPLIHGEFDTGYGREAQQLNREVDISVQKLSAAEINFRSDIFMRDASSNFPIDSGVLSHAAGAFLRETIFGQNFEEYCESVSNTAGISLSTARKSANHLAGALRTTSKKAQSSRRKNSFSVEDLEGVCPPSYGFLRVRRGSNLSVSLPGNSPGPNSVWPEALLYGYEVILRPSFRDVFTPLRLAKSLIDAGAPRSSISIIFCDHLAHDTLVNRSDLSLIFGGEQMELKYQNDPDVKVYGPGRSATIIDPKFYDSKVAAEIIDSVVGAGGVACFNTSLLLLTHPSTGFEHNFVEDLVSAVKKKQYVGQDDRPIISAEVYRNLVTQMLPRSEIEIIHDGTTSVGSTEVRAGPLVYKRRNSAVGQTILEFPFPAVEVSLLQDSDVENAVRKSLATAIYSDDTRLIHKVFHSRSGGRVLINTNSTTDFSGLPHDGHLSEFLLTERPFINSLD